MNAAYYFIAGFGDTGDYYTEERKFRTAPATGPISFVTGGDMGFTKMAADVSVGVRDLGIFFCVVDIGGLFCFLFFLLLIFFYSWPSFFLLSLLLHFLFIVLMYIHSFVFFLMRSDAKSCCFLLSSVRNDWW